MTSGPKPSALSACASPLSWGRVSTVSDIVASQGLTHKPKLPLQSRTTHLGGESSTQPELHCP